METEKRTPPRFLSRQRALQLLYQCDVRGQSAREGLASYYELRYPENHGEPDLFLERLVLGTMEIREQIDRLISRTSPSWRLDLMPAVERNILRLAAYEMQNVGTPPAIVITQSILLTRLFSEEKSVGPVRAILDRLQSSLKSPVNSG